MRYRLFGKTGLYVSELCLGTMTFGPGKGFWEPIAKLGAAEAERLIGASFDAGVNFLDTADIYSEGESEKLVGAALAALGRPREQVVVATKVFARMGPGPNQVGLSRGHIFDAIDASLRRLKLDYIDLYQIHGADVVTPIEETVRALDALVHSGKVRYVGYCNLPAWLAMKALAYADADGLARFQSAQMYYALVSRDIEREVVPLAEDQGLAILPWSPLAGGLLSGKFDLDKPGPEGAAQHVRLPAGGSKPHQGGAGSAAGRVAGDGRFRRVALAWLLTCPFVTSVIIGAKTREQLADNLAASDVQELDSQHIAQLEAASALPPEYPGWMIGHQNQTRRPASQ